MVEREFLESPAQQPAEVTLTRGKALGCRLE